MGVAFKDLVVGKEIEIKDLSGKTLIFDTYNLLYQFLSNIRARDGSLFTDSNGNTTSHLIGLLSRITNLVRYNIKLAFVFDGKAPDLKTKERERRKEQKIKAQKEFDRVKEEGDIESMRKYASRTSILDSQMITDAKRLIECFGMPIIQAPSEGEAQAVYIAKNENCYVVSQDFDSLLYGAPHLIKNLSIAGRRKKSSKSSYAIVKPEMINLADILNELGIDNDQLIAMAMLVGTDYNTGGIKGIGPKNALNLVKRYQKDFDQMFKDLKWDLFFDFPWTDVYYLFKNMPVTDDYKLEWKNLSTKKIREFLLGHDFSEERISSSLAKLEKKEEEEKQKSLFEFN